MADDGAPSCQPNAPRDLPPRCGGPPCARRQKHPQDKEGEHQEHQRETNELEGSVATRTSGDEELGREKSQVHVAAVAGACERKHDTKSGRAARTRTRTRWRPLAPSQPNRGTTETASRSLCCVSQKMAMEPAACCLLPAACCLMPAACCLLPAACCLLRRKTLEVILGVHDSRPRPAGTQNSSGGSGSGTAASHQALIWDPKRCGRTRERVQLQDERNVPL